MRIDRFITLNLVSPCYGTFGHSSAASALRLPVLMYHSISADSETGMHPYYRVCTSPARFREQMLWLKENGYYGTTLTNGLQWLRSRAEIQPPKRDRQSSAVAFADEFSSACPVALTFDDGFDDFYTHAWPVLSELGFKATLYLPTTFIGDTSRPFCPAGSHYAVQNSKPITHRKCLTWSEVKELHQGGIEVGSHTATHPKLVELSWPHIEAELYSSKSEIENHLSISCTTFAYPYAFPQTEAGFVRRFCELLRAVGYETGVTTQIGRHQSGADTFQIKRLPVNQDDDLLLFAAKLDGAYDWLGKVQSLSKSFRRCKRPARWEALSARRASSSFLPEKDTESA